MQSWKCSSVLKQLSALQREALFNLATIVMSKRNKCSAFRVPEGKAFLTTNNVSIHKISYGSKILCAQIFNCLVQNNISRKRVALFES